MEKYVVTIIAMLILATIEYRRQRTLVAATIVYPVMWVLALAGCIVQGDKYYPISWATPIVIVSGYLLFILGYNLAVKRCERIGYVQKKTEIDYQDLRVSNRVVFWMSVLVFLLIMSRMFKYMDFRNLAYSIQMMHPDFNKVERNIPGWLEALRYVMRCTLWYFSFLLFSIPKGKNYKYPDGYCPKADLTVRLLIVSGMSVLVLFTDFSRNDILMTVTPILFLYLLTKHVPDRRVVAIVLVGLVASVVIFGVTYTVKRGISNGSLVENEVNIQNSFMNYLTGSIVAFDRLFYEKGTIEIITIHGGNGKYTGSIVIAIIDKLLGSNLAPYVVQDVSIIGKNSAWTNVYTVYQWTALDFGIVYAVLWQMGFGILYGWTFTRYKQGSGISTFAYAVLSYPLVMMFFQDQYFSIAQSWLIIIAILYFFFVVGNQTKLKVRGIKSLEFKKELGCNEG